MGIQGLLPLLKSIHRTTDLKKYAGETLAVDAYGWLHRGATACAIELAQGKPTRKYIDFVMSRVRMCKHFDVTPYLIFDGDYLPSKAMTEESRHKRREQTRKTGLELLKAGKPSQAHQELQKAIDITPEMARNLIEELKKASIPYIVAPYEADAQMVYLERQGLVAGIISEDSDLLVFGAKRLLTKLDKYGGCVEINRRDFCACREVSLTGWTDAQFRQMAIFSGCDYLDSVHHLGLKTANRMLRKHKSPERVIRMLQFDNKYHVPADYSTLFTQAEQTFLYQWVYCPKAKELIHLTPLPADLDAQQLPFIGSFVESRIAQKVASGELNPMTKQEIILAPLPSPRKRTASTANHMARPPPQVVQPPSAKPIDSYFKGHRRIPLGEMEPNCFAVNPERLTNMTENGVRPIVYPLPRPYLDDTDSASSATSRTYINRAENPSRALRRRTEPVSNFLSTDGHSLTSASRRQTTGLSTSFMSTENHTLSGQLSRPPKKARLCDDVVTAMSPGKKFSRFFPAIDSKADGSKQANPKKGDGYLMSDDSIEEALKDLPDVDGWQSQTGTQKSFAVFGDESLQTTSTDISKDDDGHTTELSARESVDDEAALVPETPPKPSLSRFAFTPGSRLGDVSRTTRGMRGQSGTSSTRSSLMSLTPASINTPMSSSSLYSTASQPSTGKTTPATNRMTPLQRMGAEAFGRSKQPSTPSFKAPRPPKRSSMGRMSLESLPINPAFIPLPPVDLDEVEALHEPLGSEDMIVPESDGEDAANDIENLGRDKQDTVSKKVDLSRFLFA
ncbi:hypothetical protein F5Y15DRAFT_111416 [Xylariaceae sp. FL0016]|nr:hypothetical protein F5Y15DRAFT_111416 [Xylariaceae sp. FL0016]